MLTMKTECERCQQTLTSDQPGVFICSYECTFCEACAEGELNHCCCNCGGPLQLRPIRAQQKKETKIKGSTSAVTRPQAASRELALDHFSTLLTFETDCWDVHHAITNNRKDFVLLDVRGEALYAQGHIEGADSLPHSRINENSLTQYPSDCLFVVYCAGPHCNATEKAAIRLARLNRPVKKMIGGVTGWLDEGFGLVSS